MSQDVSLVIDMTHGGVKIALTLAKEGERVLACDIYNTLSSIDRKMLEIYGVDLIDLEDLKYLNCNLKVISPVHLPLTHDEIRHFNPDIAYSFQTHHDAVGEILNDWRNDIAKIEVTGVKGKTSTVFMLKQILSDKKPLVLSSLGVFLDDQLIKKDISITPANIKESIDLADRIGEYSSAIFECSLGGCGIGDVGVLTNISEDYSIAKNRSCASKAKNQIFKSGLTVCQKEAFDKYYSGSSANTFSLNDTSSNLYLTDAEYGLFKTSLDITYSGIKTVNGNELSGNLKVECFAPGKHHVENVLAAVTAALVLEIDENKISDALKKYEGIAGRSTVKTFEGITVIEEINPGINTASIKNSIEMIDNTEDYYISIGGDYGITCEEINEDVLIKYLDGLSYNMLFCGEVGRSLSRKMKRTRDYIKDYKDVYDLALKNNKNLLFIYRSDYGNLDLR